MEVCGTHTQNFRRFGLHKVLPPQLKLLAGPGCPVCVSAPDFIDRAILYARLPGVIIATYGDMLRVPGSSSTLERERARGASVHLVYSALEALVLAQKNPRHKVIFLAVGFETTAPTIALTVRAAFRTRVRNLFFFSSLKLIPPAMRHLLTRGRGPEIQGFLCPGHVSSIIGIKPYDFIAKSYTIGCCIAGFEPHDMLQGVLSLIRQHNDRTPGVVNQYRRLVKPCGNRRAQRIIADVFEVCRADWRGLGVIEASGLTLKKRLRGFDAEQAIPVPAMTPARKGGRDVSCRCQEVLAAQISPVECPLFRKKCSPSRPLGPCMVSSEGACNAYYRYR